jgi:hypothetical protein
MSLKDQFDEMPEGVESNDVKELRQAMLRLQKQLKQSKERNEDLVFATRQAAYDAMLTFGKMIPQFQQSLLINAKPKAKLLFGT